MNSASSLDQGLLRRQLKRDGPRPLPSSPPLEQSPMRVTKAEPPALDDFFRCWAASGAAERANYSMFLNELCELLDVPRPDPAGPDDEKNAYVFARAERGHW